MDKSTQKHPKKQTSSHGGGSRVEWESATMTEEEEDIICRMHKLVGDKWHLIAGRVPGRSAAEIESFWLIKSSKSETTEKKQRRKKSSLF